MEKFISIIIIIRCITWFIMCASPFIHNDKVRSIVFIYATIFYLLTEKFYLSIAIGG